MATIEATAQEPTQDIKEEKDALSYPDVIESDANGKKGSNGDDNQSCCSVSEVLWRDLWIEQVINYGNNPHQQERHTGDQLGTCENQQAPCLVAIVVEKSDRDGEKDNRRQKQHIQDD